MYKIHNLYANLVKQSKADNLCCYSHNLILHLIDHERQRLQSLNQVISSSSSSAILLLLQLGKLPVIRFCSQVQSRFQYLIQAGRGDISDSLGEIGSQYSLPEKKDEHSVLTASFLKAMTLAVAVALIHLKAQHRKQKNTVSNIIQG